MVAARVTPTPNKSSEEPENEPQASHSDNTSGAASAHSFSMFAAGTAGISGPKRPRKRPQMKALVEYLMGGLERPDILPSNAADSSSYAPRVAVCAGYPEVMDIPYCTPQVPGSDA